MIKNKQKMLIKLGIFTTITLGAIASAIPFLVSCSTSSTSSSPNVPNNPNNPSNPTVPNTKDTVFTNPDVVYAYKAFNKVTTSTLDPNNYNNVEIVSMITTFINSNQVIDSSNDKVLDWYEFNDLVESIDTKGITGKKDNIIFNPYLLEVIIPKSGQNLPYIRFYKKNPDCNINLIGAETVPFTAEEQEYYKKLEMEHTSSTNSKLIHKSGKYKIKYTINKYWENGELIENNPKTQSMTFDNGLCEYLEWPNN